MTSYYGRLDGEKPFKAAPESILSEIIHEQVLIHTQATRDNAAAIASLASLVKTLTTRVNSLEFNVARLIKRMNKFPKPLQTKDESDASETPE